MRRPLILSHVLFVGYPPLPFVLALPGGSRRPVRLVLGLNRSFCHRKSMVFVYRVQCYLPSIASFLFIPHSWSSATLVLLLARMNISYHPLHWGCLDSDATLETGSLDDRCSDARGLHHFEFVRRGSALSANQTLLCRSANAGKVVHMDAYLSRRSGMDLAAEALSPLQPPQRPLFKTRAIYHFRRPSRTSSSPYTMS